MGLVHDFEFWEAMSGIRTCFITGRLGGGKTLLSFAMGQNAIDDKMVEGIWANIPHVYARPGSVKNAFVIVDEAWQIMDNRYSVANFSFYGAWSRKTNTLWAFPSVYGIDKRVRALEVWRVIDIQLLPVRLWMYRWKSSFGDGGWFALIDPEKYFGTYDTKAFPINDGGALNSLMSLLPEGITLIQKGSGGRRAFRSHDESRGGRAEAKEESNTRLDELETKYGKIIAELVERVTFLEDRIDTIQILGSSESGVGNGHGPGNGAAAPVRFGE